jgi:hypothetical protein
MVGRVRVDAKLCSRIADDRVGVWRHNALYDAARKGFVDCTIRYVWC